MSNIEDVVKHYIDLQDSGSVLKACCPFHNENTPSLVVFPDTESWYCFGECNSGGDAIDFVRKKEELGFKEAKDKIKGILGEEPDLSSKKEKKKEEVNPLPPEVIKEFKKDKTYQDVEYRGIRKETDAFFRVLSKMDDKGNVISRHYPETRDRKPMGYKSRYHPKDFSQPNLGVTGVKNDLSGEFLFKGTGKYLLIVGGEEDRNAAYQMLSDYQKSRNQDEYDAIPVVSPTCGEGSAHKQVANRYDFCDKYEWIIIGMDNDKAGISAAKEIAKVLPKEKVKIATWSGKDPNQMLQEGREKQFIRDFYGAREYSESSIKTSISADKEIEKELSNPKVPLPPFMSKLEDMMAGGIPLGYIVNIIATTGAGKTTVANEALYYWIFNSPYLMGVLTLELNAGQYSIAMLSRHIGRKINLIKEPQEALEFVNRPDIIESRQFLNEKDSGEPRWILLDEREGTIDSVIEQCEIMHKKYGCRIIVIDPLQDVLEGSSQDEQLKFVKWEKMFVKKGVSIINVCHVRKSGFSTDKNGKKIKRQLTEDDVHGISAITKSAGANIILDRDKYAEDSIDKNTTLVSMPKCRWTGNGGDGGKWYYDNPTHTIYDFDTYFADKEDNQEEEGIIIEGEIVPDDAPEYTDADVDEMFN